ncbi:DUF4326 domain-containing protein [Sinorhizobium meliloti]|uniref:DUF4326 domain-containing protein n=1 Tax=Rhizobium meliloti TaxID=382 RepID=UPI0002861509|nr:DUF4326 domain-containing protein [Sinorhizobium meliloti]ASP79619.1 DUF4326 domain-containing protein [Sinorhizobium meliloti]MQW17360.1 DUF4326 domain-containing protein [Sinorhizobium meliloti]CCM66760.1 hypothetical protein BN406_00715 [Sinorhizobium meliloti Rm41]
MTKPVRLQLSRSKGFDLQAASRAANGLPAVNVARPTLFGNPFIHHDPAAAVEAYRRHCEGGTKVFEMGPGKLQFAQNVHRNSLHHAWSEWLRTEGLPALRGKNLACWCKPEVPCHADVLLELANRPQCDEMK